LFVCLCLFVCSFAGRLIFASSQGIMPDSMVCLAPLRVPVPSIAIIGTLTSIIGTLTSIIGTVISIIGTHSIASACTHAHAVPSAFTFGVRR